MSDLNIQISLEEKTIIYALINSYVSWNDLNPNEIYLIDSLFKKLYGHSNQLMLNKINKTG